MRYTRASLRPLILFFVAFLSVSSEARTVRPYSANGKMTEDYAMLTSRDYLRPDDVIAFPDGENFIYDSYVGEGNSSKVLRVHRVRTLEDGTESIENLVLRLPKRTKRAQFSMGKNSDLRALIRSTIEGYADLRSAGVEVPDLRYAGGDQYVAFDFVPSDFGGTKFFEDPGSIDPAMLEDARVDLIAFARTTASFSAIGDFRADQIVYDHSKRKWILIDWTRFHERPSGFRLGTVFDSRFARDLRLIALKYRRPITDEAKRWQRKVLGEIAAAIADVRKDSANSVCLRLLYSLRARR